MNVKIEKLIYGGEGLAHHDGHTVFVPFVLPEEVVAVRPTETKKKFIRGRVEHLVIPSQARVPPPCPHFTACGGCHYQHIPYEAQLDFKAQILRETLSRIGHIRWEGDIWKHPSPPFGYRNRAQWKVRAASPGGAQRPGIGYFRQGSSALCAVEACPILAPRLEEILQAFAGLLAAQQLDASLREVEAFTDAAGQKVLLNVSVAGHAGPLEALARTLRGAISGIESVLVHDAARDLFHLDGPGFLHYHVGDFDYRVGHLSFFQVNRFVLDELVRTVSGDEAGRLALDLFAGVGLFTLPLARRFSRVVAAEANPAAARDLSANLEFSNGVAEAVATDAQDFLKNFSDQPDFVFLDPPRAGLPADLSAQLAALSPARISYLSCDPATLARDLAALTAAGYRLAQLDLFDVFPQTYHIETLARLEKAS